MRHNVPQTKQARHSTQVLTWVLTCRWCTLICDRPPVTTGSRRLRF